MTDMKAVQRRLAELGFDPGKIDGLAGKKTTAAVVAFQIASGLAADGKVGPRTSAALFPDKPITRPEGAAIPKPSATGGPWPLQKDCMKFYGGVGLNQVMLDLPYPMRLAWAKNTIVRRISCHQKVAASAGRAFAKIARHYPEAQRKDMGLDLFGGCLNVRKMRGGSSYSMHSWGIAIDFDPERNQLKWKRDRARLAKPDAEAFWKFWEEEGWVSLGRARNFDWMHVQAARL
ncbi:MAG: peptidoglycan-binding protein [Hyphomicrobiales bacterium]|nr:peptidoglycan-binding protein [Hyphomicrobiales bacterium]